MIKSQKRFKKNEGKSQKIWSNLKKNKMKKVEKVTKFNSIYNHNSMTSLD